MLRWSRFDACSIQGHKPRIAALVKCRLLRAMSEFEGKAEDKCSH
jgi:hypothetical protein